MANFTHVQQVDLDYELALCSIYDIINNFFFQWFLKRFLLCVCVIFLISSFILTCIVKYGSSTFTDIQLIISKLHRVCVCVGGTLNWDLDD